MHKIPNLGICSINQIINNIIICKKKLIGIFRNRIESPQDPEGNKFIEICYLH